MFDLTRFNQYNFHDGFITECKNCNSYSVLRGEFPEDETERSGGKYFTFDFNSVDSPLPEVKDAELFSFEITGRQNAEKGYSVKIWGYNGFRLEIPLFMEFSCKDIHFSVQKYEGRSVQCYGRGFFLSAGLRVSSGGYAEYDRS